MADPSVVQSRSQEAEIQFAVAYWIRTLLSSRNIPIKELVALVMKFHPSLFEWDYMRCAIGLSISNGSQTVTRTYIERDYWKSVFAKHVIERRNKIIRWEVTMKHMGEECGEGEMQMGIMDADYIHTADADEAIGDQNHQSGFFIADDCKPGRYINGSRMPKWDGVDVEAINWHIGDRAKLEIKNGRCLVYCNDKLLGNLTDDDLPEKFYFAISLQDARTACETTLFEIIHD